MGISRFIKSICVQTAVYWGEPSDDGYGGIEWNEAGHPREIGVRWDLTSETVMASNGEEITSQAKVLVTEDLSDQSYLFLGSLEELTDEEKADPRKIQRDYPDRTEVAHQIRRIDKVPMIKSTTEFVRTVYL